MHLQGQCMQTAGYTICEIIYTKQETSQNRKHPIAWYESTGTELDRKPNRFTQLSTVMDIS